MRDPFKFKKFIKLFLALLISADLLSQNIEYDCYSKLVYPSDFCELCHQKSQVDFSAQYTHLPLKTMQVLLDKKNKSASIIFYSIITGHKLQTENYDLTRKNNVYYLKNKLSNFSFDRRKNLLKQILSNDEAISFDCSMA